MGACSGYLPRQLSPDLTTRPRLRAMACRRMLEDNRRQIAEAEQRERGPPPP